MNPFSWSNKRRVELVIVNLEGLHLAPAQKIAALAKNAGGRISLRTGQRTVDAKDVVAVLTLASPRGTRFTAAAENAADAPVLSALAALFESGFGETIAP